MSGFEPLTCRLQEVCSQAAHALAAPMAQVIALTAPAALGLFGASSHEPFHADGGQRSIAVTERSGQNAAAAAPQLAMVRQDTSNRSLHCRIGPYLDQGGSAALSRGPAPRRALP